MRKIIRVERRKNGLKQADPRLPSEEKLQDCASDCGTRRRGRGQSGLDDQGS